MEFHLQDYLHDMRAEQQRDHRDLLTKIDGISSSMLERIDAVSDEVNKHDTRIVVVENTRKTIRWFVAALVAATLAMAGDIIENHLPHAAAAVVLGERR